MGHAAYFDPRGQTPYPILIIFNRLPKGTICNMLAKHEVPVSKTVGGSVFTGRHGRRADQSQYSWPSTGWPTINSQNSSMQCCMRKVMVYGGSQNIVS